MFLFYFIIEIKMLSNTILVYSETKDSSDEGCLPCTASYELSNKAVLEWKKNIVNGRRKCEAKACRKKNHRKTKLLLPNLRFTTYKIQGV